MLRDRLEHSSEKHRFQSSGNSPSSQHFCYTGVTAVDVAISKVKPNNGRKERRKEGRKEGRKERKEESHAFK